jgi:hypothetical protein
MLKKYLYYWLFILSIPFISGCANRAVAELTPGTDLTKLQSFYVVKFAPDGRGINVLIRDRLVLMGYSAKTGSETNIPDNVDAVVTYEDKWMWDITMYMIELTITMRDPKSSFPLATGNSYHTSLTRLSPEEMVAEVLTSIFSQSGAGGK